MFTPRQQRKFGFICGFVLGFVNSLVVNMINHVFLPGIHLHEPWPGIFIFILFNSLVAGSMGAIALWTEDSFNGLLLSALLGSGINTIWSLIIKGQNPATFFLMILIFLPTLIFYFPLGIAVRWIAHQWNRANSNLSSNSGKIIITVICILLAGVSGVFSLYPAESRLAFVTADQLVQDGLKAKKPSELPIPLKDVEGFYKYAQENYTLDLSFETDRLAVPFTPSEYGLINSLIIIRFQNGYSFGCIFSTPGTIPVCGNFY